MNCIAGVIRWLHNGGKCGICGDAYHLKQPRPHETGGEFGRGIISRHYFSGQIIDIVIELTSNHRGRFELYLCPNNNPKQEATQSCFDRYPLYVYGTNREVRYLIPPDSNKKETFYYKVKLPPYLTCSQCVLQWTYYTGNMWGRCPNGTEGLGCGHAETFRNCADIRIVSSSSGLPPQFVNTLSHSALSRENSLRSGPQLSYPSIVQSQVCRASKTYQVIAGMDKWCQANCVNFPSVCPVDFCTCPSSCIARGDIEGMPGADEYCQDQCIVYGAKCPKNRCFCS